jgi:ATP-dependent Lon protease
MDQSIQPHTVVAVLPLADDVVLPGMAIPVDLSDDRARAAVSAARSGRESPALPGIRSNRGDSASARLLLVPELDGKPQDVGTLAVIEQVGRLPGGGTVAVVRGVRRVVVGDPVEGPGEAQWAHATELADEIDDLAAVRELAREYKDVVISILEERGLRQLIDSVRQVDDPTAIADLAGYAAYLTTEQKLELLRNPDVAQRLRFTLDTAREHLAELKVSESIRKDVQDGVNRQQREFLLRRQLEATRKELGELTGESDTEQQDYRQRIEQAGLPEKVKTAALAEVDKLERTSEQSPEVGWIRTWLDTLLVMPWNDRTEDAYDIAAARQILDADHTGLDDVKERIVEHLAVRRLRKDRGLDTVGGRRGGAVLVLVGPPGVGKTSLGESVARAMGRKFVRVALGGVRDEAEIRGHRRTYVGAQSGRIARAIREAGSMNPVMLLDEVDKVGADYRGDPTAALLEVLDPEQNHTFRDHYLEVELDLSDVLFLATANVVETIPSPLLDRMELVELDGYTEAEKVTIARDHLLPRQQERAGLTGDEVVVTDAALRKIAGEYTHEAGVRSMERALAKALRKVATKLSAQQVSAPVTVEVDDLVGYLGRPKHIPEQAERTAVPGVATGLAVTGAGGDVLFVEASLAERESGASGLTLTGQLGEVMKESAQIALSYLRSRGAEQGLPVGDLTKRAIHLHVPAGAVPKDGPSAGVTMTTALASLLSGRLVRSDVGMTGEVSLTGRVLPVGGIKQKLLAAHRAGLTTVVIPQRNEADLDELPEEVRAGLDIRPVSDIREVLDLALEPAATPAAA